MSKEKFNSKKSFILASIGAAVGLGNALRFPGLCAEYGGGSFLFVYFIALITLGLPLLNAEIALGRKIKSGAPVCMQSLDRGKKGMLGLTAGWAASANSVLTAVIYAGLAGWIIATVFGIVPLSINAPNLTRAEISENFFKNVLSARQDGVICGISPLVTACIAVAWVLMFVCLKGGAKSLSVAAKYTVIIPIALLLLMAGRGLLYENSAQALVALFVPDFSKLASAELWITALGQVFFSLSVAVGIMPVYGSYLPSDANIFTCSLAVAAADFLVSVLASVVMFTTLYGCGLENAISSSGIITAFSVYPVAIACLFGKNVALNAIVGALFYLSLAMMAVQAAVSMLEAFIAPYCEAKGIPRKKPVIIICIAGAGASVIFATTAAPIIVEIADKFVNFYNVLLLCIAECLLFAFSDKVRPLAKETNAYAVTLPLGHNPSAALRHLPLHKGGLGKRNARPRPLHKGGSSPHAHVVKGENPLNTPLVKGGIKGGLKIVMPETPFAVSVKYLCPAALICLTALQGAHILADGLIYPFWLLAPFGFGLSLAVAIIAVAIAVRQPLRPPTLSF